ncbi:type III pantothenate kinase [Marinobacter salinisoli]|uniref:Type III pantothenate kinase n=1 Tax=Marinobacter salinisoli TaxID=2769486 RepID=A0ABX7MUB7_9GAMM|nr:type III pantothenate kinase [Marinobacter salinisoli]QSP95982.1 type III pantothenate kinase [Marinobacter salinisoli]
MRLLVDAGNTRIKWRLDSDGRVVDQGAALLVDRNPLAALAGRADAVERVAVSVVAAEEQRERLSQLLSDLTGAPVRYHWAEAARGGLVNAYSSPSKMGADRWHAMYGAWASRRQGCAVVDAGSAVTVDYVDDAGRHLGGFILPGLQMMFRSLKTDAARIGFDPDQVLEVAPGRSTTECVNHGLAWLSAGMVSRIQQDMASFGLRETLVTGGDADRLVRLGLNGIIKPGLVLDGLAKIDGEELAG